jgi:hypothetical protein
MQSGADCQFVLDAPCDRIARQASVRWDENAASRFTNHQHSPGLVGRRRLLLCFCSGQEASRSRSRDHVAAWATKQKRTQLAMSSSWRLDSRDRRSGADRRGRLPSRQSPPCQLAPDDRRWRLLDGCRQLTREPPVLAPRSCRGLAPRGALAAQRGVFRATTAETCRAGKGGLPRTSASAEFACGLQEIQRRQIDARLAWRRRRNIGGPERSK